MPKNNKEITVEMTPEEIEIERVAIEAARLKTEQDREVERLKKENIERIGAKINGTEDLVAIFKEAGVQTSNHRKYIDELIASENEAELDAILSYKVSAKTKTDASRKEQEVFKVLSKLKTIPKKNESNPIVVKYLAEQEALEAKLNELLGE